MRHVTPVRIVVAVLVTLAPARADDPSLKDLIAKARQGDTRSQLALAYRYRDGNGVKRGTPAARPGTRSP